MEFDLFKVSIYLETRYFFRFHDGKKVNTIDCGAEAALWLSRYILEKDFGLRLGYNKGTDESDTPKTQNLSMDYYKQLSSNSLVGINNSYLIYYYINLQYFHQLGGTIFDLIFFRFSKISKLFSRKE